MTRFREHTTCRVCNHSLGAPYLDLGEQPLANALRDPEDTTPEFKVPLAVACCPDCGLSQLTVVVDPEVLYTGYRFRSGESELWKHHCNELAGRCTYEALGGPGLGVVLDIACNDGTLLNAFEGYGWQTIGVDPAPTDDRCLKGFWDEVMAGRVLDLYGPVDLVIAQNVLGHVDDPVSFLKAAESVLKPNGKIVVEVPDLTEMVRTCSFDTIYHEHLSYWNAATMSVAVEAAGLNIQGIEWLNVHGGSMRFWLGTTNGLSLQDPDLQRFSRRVLFILHDTARLLTSLKDKRVWAYGASAKGAVMLNALPFCPVPWTVLDDCEAKQGYDMPGLGIPILKPPESLTDVDVIWVLSWNNAASLKAKARERGFTGKFLLTQPTVRLED